MFSKNRLNVTFNPHERTDLSLLEGVVEVIQLVPDADPDDEFFDFFILTVEEEYLEELYNYISELPEVKECEKVPLKKATCQESSKKQKEKNTK